MGTDTIDNYSTFNESRRPKWWIWVAVVIVACCCLTCVGLIGFIAYFGREPENLSVDYQVPSVVSKGENFDLMIMVTNSGTESLTITSLDLDQAFGGSILDGCIVLETDPFMERDYSLEGIKVFNYGKPIAAGQTQTFTFHLQATTVGEFGGSIGVYVGDIAKQIDYIGIIVRE
jgi:hypothetical protein